MKLTISRNQSGKMLGGVNFELHASVQLTPHESDLVNRYKAGSQVLMKKEIRIPLTNRAVVLDITIGSLLNGQVFKSDNIGEILEYEENVKAACEQFKSYLEVMNSFGGSEVIEYEMDMMAQQHA